MHDLRLLVLAALMLLSTTAVANFHTYRIHEVYSNADGTIQYIVLRESLGSNGEDIWAGHVLTATSTIGVDRAFMFPAHLPSSSTANTYVLVATQGFAALGLITPDYIIPDGFVPVAGGQLNFGDVDAFEFGPLPVDGIQALFRDGIGPNEARNFQGASASVKPATATPAVPSFEGLFYAAPAESESGWGINVAHQGDVIFATWFTYDLAGKAWWLTMTAEKTGEGLYSGVIRQTRGPAFYAVPFDPAGVTLAEVGSGTLAFTDIDNGSFTYTVNGTSQVKPITRQVFASVPTCTFGGEVDLMRATNFQGLWYAAPAESEAGWGVNFTHQGDIIFATWFTYDGNGAPLWLTATARLASPGVYEGTLYRTTGPAFNSVPFSPASVKLLDVGTLTISFANGNSATFTYAVKLDGPAGTVVQQSKSIVRQVFRAPGTVCH